MTARTLWTVLVLLLTMLAVPANVFAQDQAPNFTVQTITVPDARAFDFEVSPDGRYAALYTGPTASALLGIPTAGYSVTPDLIPIRIVDLSSGETVAQLVGNLDLVHDAAFSADSGRLAVHYRNGEILVWETGTFTFETRFDVPLTFAASMQFLPEGESLLVLDQAIPNAFYVWDIATGYMTGIWRPPLTSFGELKLDDPQARFHLNYVTFALSPDASLMATATATGTVALWDTASLQRQTVQLAAADLPQFNIRKVVFSEDGQRLAYFDQTSGQTHVWDIASLTETAVYPAGGASFALSADGSILAWATRREVQFAPTAAPDQVETVVAFPEDYASGPVLPMTFIAGTNQLVVGGMAYLGEEDNPDNYIYLVTFGE